MILDWIPQTWEESKRSRDEINRYRYGMESLALPGTLSGLCYSLDFRSDDFQSTA